jgi:two-component system, LytTR family, response regulator
MPKNVLKCLIIEDNTIHAEYLQGCIEQMPEKLFFAKHCDNAIDAKRIIESETIDLIFLDLELNGRMNGIDFLECVTIPQKVIVVSAIPKLMEETYAYKIDGYLKKPFSIEQFQAKINHLNVSENVTTNALVEPSLEAPKEVEKPYYDLIVTTKNERGTDFRLIWDELVYIQTKDGQVHLHLVDGTVMSIWKPTMTNLLKDAPPGKCCQVHKSYAAGNPNFYHKRVNARSELVLKYLDKSNVEKFATIFFSRTEYGEQINQHFGII